MAIAGLGDLAGRDPQDGVTGLDAHPGPGGLVPRVAREVVVRRDAPVVALAVARRGHVGDLVRGLPEALDRLAGAEQGVRSAGRRGQAADPAVELLAEARDVALIGAPDARQRVGAGDRGQQDGADDGHRHEGQAAAHEEAGDVAGVADPAPDPAAALLVEVGAHQQQQPGRREDDEVGEERLEGQREVRQEEQAEDDEGVHRSMPAEDGERGIGAGAPGDAAGHQQEGRRLRASGPGARRGRSRSGRATCSARSGRADSSAAVEFTAGHQDDDQDDPDDGADEVDEGGRQLRLGAHEAPDRRPPAA